MRSFGKQLFGGICVCLVLLLPMHGYATPNSVTPPPETVNLAIIYAITAALALLFVIGYCVFVKSRRLWLLFLFIAVFAVNVGYFALAISKTLSEALLANRLSYLGSVFLPLCMLMSVMEMCHLQVPRWGVGTLIGISVAVFLVAASQGYCKLYYSDVSLEFVGGMARLVKTYGPLHNLYFVYLAVYFASMLAAIAYASVKKRFALSKHAILLAVVVLLNLSIWFIEQLIRTPFEFLSVSYIVSELLLLLLFWIVEDNAAPAAETGKAPEPQTEPDTAEDSIHIDAIMANWSALDMLTVREREVVRMLLEDRRRREIAELLHVSENTIKKHTSNIFSKLQVHDRTELYAKAETETN